jgi:hypothetical protein
MIFRKRIASRRSIAAICEPGTVLPGEDGGETQPLIRQAFACLHPAPRPAGERQSHVVGPDGQPRPSGRNGCEPCAQAPHPAPLQSALEKRPSRAVRAEHKRASEHGDAYPHHEMFRGRISPLVIPGRAASREPGIHVHSPDSRIIMDSVPAPTGASRNDGEDSRTKTRIQA